ncbi:MAG: lasso peptide biosynthesis B2 protein [Bacteroidetes bacterium]|nr:lasso peptide biosynthesis B2 protein [Bacteroidota bacterium]
MSIRKRIRTYNTSTQLDRQLFALTMIACPFFRVALLAMPFSRVLAWQGVPGEETTELPDPGSLAYRKAMHVALLRTARYFPWAANCYALCLAGKFLLRKQGISSTLYLGFYKTPEGCHQGHAWLRSHDTWISGGGQRYLYCVHSCYS